MFFINKMSLHCFVQQYVSTVAMNHLQVDQFFLCKANHTISNARAETYHCMKQCKDILLIKNIKQVVSYYILPIYFMIL